MTRINLTPPSTLHSKHLLAEYRELPRIFGQAMAAEKRGLAPNMVKIPSEFCLGTGHVTFFYNKLGWLKNRFAALVDECLRRGFNVQHTNIPLGPNADHWWNDWTPRSQDIALSAQRIFEKTPAHWAKK